MCLRMRRPQPVASHTLGPDLVMVRARSLGRRWWARGLHSRSGGGGPNERQHTHVDPIAVDGLSVPMHGLSRPIHRFSFFYLINQGWRFNHLD